MFGQQHVLPYKQKGEDTIAWILSKRQLAWLVGGAFLCVKLTEYIPGIPGLGTWGYIPHWIPFGICLIFAFVKHPPTGMYLGRFLWHRMNFKRQKKVFHRKVI